MLPRIRSLVMKDRIAQLNQSRGLLAEYGIVIPQNAERVRQQLPLILEDATNELTPLTRQLEPIRKLPDIVCDRQAASLR